MLSLARATAKAAPQLARLAPRTAAPAYQRLYHAGAPTRKEEESSAPATKTVLTPGTLIEKLGLDDWTRALPVGLIFAIPALSQEWVVLSEETQLLGCFMLFVGTIYTKFGDSIGAALDAQADAILETRNKDENAQIELVQQAIAFHKARLDSADIMADLIAIEREAMTKQATLQSALIPHMTRDTTVAMLDTMVAAQANEWNAEQDSLVRAAVDTVSQQVLSDKKLKKTALDEAMIALADPGKAPAADAVSGLFTQFFQDKAAKAKTELSQERSVTDAQRKALTEHIDAMASRFASVEGVKEQAEAAKKLIPAKYTGSLEQAFLRAQAKARGISI